MKQRLSRQERKAQTRDLLLDAAADLFARRGYEAASLDEVAEAAGFTKGAVYSNFANKEELFFALVDRRIRRESTRMAAGLGLVAPDQPSSLDEDAGRGQPDGPAFPSEAGRLDEPNARWLVLSIEFWLHAMRHDRTRQLMAAEYERFRHGMAEMIGELTSRVGIEPPLPPQDLAVLIEAIGTGLAVQAALDPGHVDMALQRKAIALLVGPEMARAAGIAPEDGSTAPDRNRA